MAKVLRDERNDRRSPASNIGRVVETRELPGKVVVRHLRSDVYSDALRAAESTLRTQRQKSSDKKS
jgi:hypothetical protein